MTAVASQHARTDAYYPKHRFGIDTTFWKHHSMFAGTQQQLDELRREADQKAAVRAFQTFVNDPYAEPEPIVRQSLRAAHRPGSAGDPVTRHPKRTPAPTTAQDRPARSAAHERQASRQLRAQSTTRPPPAAEARSVVDVHRPAVRELKGIIHVGLFPMLWIITSCKCGHRWPCNTIKQHLRDEHGWTSDITGHLKTLTQRLPKPRLLWRKHRPDEHRPDEHRPNEQTRTRWFSRRTTTSVRSSPARPT